MSRPALLIPLLMLCAQAAAQEPKPDCANQITQLDMNLCAAMDFDKADAELNEVWKDAREVARQLDRDISDTSLKGAEKSLLDAQRAWIGYRDGSCALAGWEARGGSMEPMLVSSCLETMTKARTTELRAFIGENKNE